MDITTTAELRWFLDEGDEAPQARKLFTGVKAEAARQDRYLRFGRADVGHKARAQPGPTKTRASCPANGWRWRSAARSRSMRTTTVS